MVAVLKCNRHLCCDDYIFKHIPLKFPLALGKAEKER